MGASDITSTLDEQAWGVAVAGTELLESCGNLVGHRLDVQRFLFRSVWDAQSPADIDKFKGYAKFTGYPLDQLQEHACCLYHVAVVEFIGG